MIKIKKNMKMADAIFMNYLLVSVIHRFGIILGFGDKTIEEVCYDYKINTKFFLEILNAFHLKNYFPKKQLQSFSIELIISYLKKTHYYFSNEKIPQIENLINTLIKENEQEYKNIILLKNFFLEYKKEFLEHISKEETLVYPYAINLEKLINNKVNEKIKNKVIKQFKNYPIQTYLNEHTNIEEKLLDLKNIIIKYLPPLRNCKNCNLNLILFELFKLENDLNEHSLMEEKILVPKVNALEKKLNALINN